jgi:putative membrane protein
MKQNLSENDRSVLERRIAETEKATGAQIVLASIKRSDSYAEIPWKAFALGASIASLVIIILDLFVLGWMTDILILFSLAVVLATGAMFAILTVLFPVFARLFLAPQRKETETMQYSESLFLSNELFSTEGRRGILVLVSQFERQVVILPDTGIRDLLSLDVLNELISEMKSHLKRNKLREALATGLDGIHSALNAAAPGRREKNELSDEIIEEEGV